MDDFNEFKDVESCKIIIKNLIYYASLIMTKEQLLKWENSMLYDGEVKEMISTMSSSLHSHQRAYKEGK
ncbi:hypothetical protein FNE58_20210 [Bacillus thuringiensis]|nr:hypothetical protein [Bacillus thuringiensis]MEB8656186.1 hypothetical protein [Bacillus cereus]ETE93516.1 hypothetical protein C623_0225305 [Bacillus thuringiensis serovar aizawai str. Hu4-2]MDR5041756.1 hypothetical protein [Bacillus thuringiensis]MEB8720658.1 hypothetical protein [Bacillus cereus]MEB8989314.1 hypothetical protein [Bacillus cereus]